MIDIIKTFINVKDGLKTYVTKHERGFAVSLKDTDADEFAGITLIYPELKKALADAEKIVIGINVE
jgi:hypothetical protein